MAVGLIKNNTVIGVEKEVTEGTYVAPAGVNSFVQPLDDGFDLGMTQELIDRAFLDASPGKPAPRLGMKGATAALPVEFKASGVEGGAPDYDALMETVMGNVRSGTLSTTKAGNSSTVLQIEDADISKYNVGDIVVVKEAGAFESRPIKAVDPSGGAANIELEFALTNGAPADNVDVAAFRTWHPASKDHPSLSLSYYWANEIRQAALGAKVSGLTLDNWTTGQLASWNFSLEALTFNNEVDGVAPFTPVFDTGVPPIILEACVWKDGVLIPINTLGLSIANTLGFLTDTCSPNGRTSSRVTVREITGNFNPHKDDTLTEFFDDWNNETIFSIFAVAFNPAAVAGEWIMGSVVGIWLPFCFSTEFQTADLEGILVDNVSFRATRGLDGTSDEAFIGVV